MDNFWEDPRWLYLFLGVMAAVVVIGLIFYSRASRTQIDKKAAPDTKLPPPLPKPVESPASSLPVEKPIAAPAQPTSEERVSQGLSRTRSFFQQTFDRLFADSKGEQFFGDMEEVLLTADIGIDFTEQVVADLKKSFGVRLPERQELKSTLSQILMAHTVPPQVEQEANPRVIMIAGVNGAGKTTTIAKLCQRYQAQNKKVLVGAADTFRAAAVDQLKTWVERLGVEGVFQKEGSDPSAVAFDAVQAAVARRADICLIDTAGRLHTKTNLMEELKKMKRVITKAMPGAPHDVWLVVDGSTGQNALNQAREFHTHLGLTGVVVTKLDGSAKGGAVLAISSQLKLPVVFIGVGESPEDLVPFNGPAFIETILSGL